MTREKRKQNNNGEETCKLRYSNINI